MSAYVKPEHPIHFWIGYLLVPVIILSALVGTWTVLLPPFLTWYLFGALDALIGRYKDNADPQTPEADLYWFRMATMLWPPVQFVLLLWIIWYVPRAEHLGLIESFMVVTGMGIASGAVGIVFSHELMHQKNRLERRLSEWLLAMVLYSRFRTEHLLVHHIHVGTPRDTVTARYNEHFHRYFKRVMKEGFRSAWQAEKAMLARKNLPATSLSNPFWRYWAAQGAMLLLAFLISGWLGILVFCYQALVAIWQLELTNYVEHYGLTRAHKGDGKYEPALPRHSWNANQRVSNWLLINLQRHSDHHYKPDRRFPLLQDYPESEAPLLPYGYPVMTLLALYPKYWRKVMNPRVAAWRAQFYPEIEDWTAYNKGQTPVPA
ncbi:MAG: alkane 1-monooxygenase [Paracoccaceae bacterium]|jgi:alkane 1-monooxygenase|nr:alkane 1-monooxygenase [Paracoccaceae bacterium]MDP7185999.1 alkane 1-monooxygenase [Paracoccaceae bacterium]